MLSKSLIQVCIDGRGPVPSLLLDLRPNYGGGNEDNDYLLQKVPCMHCCTQCSRTYSRPLPTYASIRGSWSLTDKSESVSCGVIAPFFWVLVHTRFCFFLTPKNLFPQSCVSSLLKSHWPTKSNSLGVLSPCARIPGWTHNSVGPRTFLTARECL